MNLQFCNKKNADKMKNENQIESEFLSIEFQIQSLFNFHTSFV